MKSIVICSSARYRNEVKAFCNTLKELGVTVFEPNIYEYTEESTAFESERITKAVFKGFTLEHFDWIRKADTCFVYNKDGYIGRSVSLEMGYATALGKPLYALEAKTGDPCSDCLIDKVVNTPENLAKLLS